eukprot:5814355-Alexandrium_andersonii.AAC.1
MSSSEGTWPNKREMDSSLKHPKRFHVDCSRRVSAVVCGYYDLGVPVQLLRVIFLLLACPSAKLVEDADACEFFAGQQAVTRALQAC